MGYWPWSSKGFWGALIVTAAGIYTFITEDVKTGIILFGTGLALLGIRHHLEEMLEEEE